MRFMRIDCMIDYEIEVTVKALVSVSAKSAAEAERVVASMQPELSLHTPEINQLENADATYRQHIHRIAFVSTQCKECGRNSYSKSRVCRDCSEIKCKCGVILVWNKHRNKGQSHPSLCRRCLTSD